MSARTKRGATRARMRAFLRRDCSHPPTMRGGQSAARPTVAGGRAARAALTSVCSARSCPSRNSSLERTALAASALACRRRARQSAREMSR
eukprot:3351023-Prymnesium_polylepis.1